MTSIAADLRRMAGLAPVKAAARERPVRLYSVTVVDKGAKTVLAIVAASTSEAAKNAKDASAGRVSKIRELRQRAGMKPADRRIFIEQLAVMTEAKMGISRALAAMRDSQTGASQHAAAHLLANLQRGMGLAEAMRARPQDWPAPTVSIIEGGMHGGNLAAALRDAIAFEEAFADVGKGANGDVTKGVLSIMIGAAICIATPPLIAMVRGGFEQGDIPETPSTMRYMELMNKADLAGWIGGGLGVLMLALLAGLFLLAGPGRRVVPDLADRVILSLPYFREIVLAQGNFAVLRAMSLLARSGLRIDDVLSMSEPQARGALKTSLKAARRALAQGNPWASAMAALSATDRAAIATAPDRESLSTTLKSVARQYQAIYAARISQVVPALQGVGMVMMMWGVTVITLESMWLVSWIMEGTNATTGGAGVP